MTDIVTHKFPAQQLPYKQKGKKWRRECVDFACDNVSLANATNRKPFLQKQINYDLLNGKLHMDDIEKILNPTNLRDDLVPEEIQHYPIINPKIALLTGEESKRLFDYKVIITDPNSLSEASKRKTEELLQDLQQLIENASSTQEEFAQKIEDLNKYYSYSWQDFREIRANRLLNHYSKEDNFAVMFNDGFYDALVVGEELYLNDIVGGEPVIEKLDPREVTALFTSHSSRIEDADMIIIQSYWSPGKITDVYYDSLTAKDREYINKISEEGSISGSTDDMGNWIEKNGFARIGTTPSMLNVKDVKGLFDKTAWYITGGPCDADGNIRVIRVFWKSRRKIKKVTSYDPMTGEEVISFQTEDYVIDKVRGEKEEILWVNEAWEGTKIGEDVYVNIRPRPIQYNTLGNPSRCHFGIVGSIYAHNGDRPYSMVDMMKPYNYLYDVIHDRLNRAIARNYGKIAKLDMALTPDGWEVDKWLYFMRKDGIAVVDSAKEFNSGPMQGKVSGMLNNASNGAIDLDMGNIIQQYLNILEFAKMEMSEAVGITKQREGQIANRETVGGVERATLQSSHITEYWFMIHDDVKRRVLECFIETAKIALKGRNKKFQYLLPDFAQRMVEIDGDQFAESDYGIVVDSSQQSQELMQKMDGMIQAALQNQMINFSTALKMFSSCSLAEKMRMIEENERELQQRQQEAQQQQLQVQQQEAQMRAEQEQAKLELENVLNERDNDTRLAVAVMQSNSKKDVADTDLSKDALVEKMREFDLKLQLDKDRLAFDKSSADADRQLKREQIKAKSTK